MKRKKGIPHSTVPQVPLSHPFIERLIGAIRREYLDRVFFWNVVDLARKLGEFRDYYNEYRVQSLTGWRAGERTA
ncbi:MAG: transposase [Betaproteobacteria bacterium]|nr:transposase [Betaproteobacteria bacterium]